MVQEELIGQNSVMLYTVCLSDNSGVTIKRVICRGMDDVSTLMLSTNWSKATLEKRDSPTPTTH